MQKKTKRKKKKNFWALYYVILIITFAVLCIVIFMPSNKKTSEQNPVKPPMQPPAKTEQQKEIKTPPVVVPPKPQEAPMTGFQKYKFKYIYSVDIKGNINKYELKINVPQNDPGKQYIKWLNVSMKPANLYKNDELTTAEYKFENISNQKIDIVLEGIANVRTYNIKIAEEINKNPKPETNLQRYLQPEPLIESDDSYIKNIAAKIQGTTRKEIVNNIFKYTQQSIDYRIIYPNAGAKKALKQKYGKCSEYAAIMTALCRAKNIPARIVIGNIAREGDTKHNWVEVYFDEYGWVNYDPTAVPTLVTTYDKKGNVIKREKRYGDVVNNQNYIISGRNKFEVFTSHSMSIGNRPGQASVKEIVQIQKAE